MDLRIVIMKVLNNYKNNIFCTIYYVFSSICGYGNPGIRDVIFKRSIAIGTKGYEKAASEFENQLNKLGEEGWELVQRTDGFFFFKREITVFLN